MRRSNDIIDIELAVHRDTGRAYLVEVYDSGIQAEKVWIPHQLVEERCEKRSVHRRLPVYRFRIKDWVLIEKGMV